MDVQTTKHEIFIGRKHEGELVNRLIAGHAFLRESETFYTVRMMIFPGQCYYLTKNRDSVDRYTLFSKIIREQNGVWFQNPIGSGRLTADLSAYLQVYIPVLGLEMFMSLFPKD